MKLQNKKVWLFFALNVGLLITGFYLAIILGATKVNFSDIWNSIFMPQETLEHMLIRDVRLPRALCVLLTGGVLGICGSMIQGVTRNPIAEPSLLGVSQGGTLVIAIFYGAGVSINTGSTMVAASIGALFAGGLVIAFTSRNPGNMSVGKLLLAGTALSTFFISLTTIIGLLTNRSQFIAFWVAGGFRNATWQDFWLIALVGIPGVLYAIYLSPKINILNLGDDTAIGLGESPEKIRYTTLLLMIPMCAAAVAVGKNIGFVGLIVPQLVRMILGQDYRKNIPFSFLLGSVLLTFADTAARMLYDPYETPIGIFTAIIGVPFFIILARKERG